MDPVNPYAVPSIGSENQAVGGPHPSSYSMVSQVQVIGILQIVLGALEFMLAAILIINAIIIMPLIMQSQPGGLSNTPRFFNDWIVIYYWCVGGLMLIFSIIRIASGIASFWFRSRRWMIASLLGGMVSLLSCYCLPFSIALGIYGMIVMFHSGVIRAYAMGQEGIPPSEIKRRFASGQG